MTEFEIRDEVRKRAHHACENKQALDIFIEDVVEKYNNDYGGVCYAIGNAAYATAMYLAHKCGITGFQAGEVMWEFIRQWDFRNNECGLRIINYDDLCYPQYLYKFEGMKIPQEVWDRVIKKCQNLMKNEEHACNKVKQHWSAIANGFIPRELIIEKENN